jgi:chromosome segregation protein
MRIRRLDLLRYGHLADRVLEFPAESALHVVHGVNEAGKSTALAAIADALFGFGHRSDYDFLPGKQPLRIGFSLTAQDGTGGDFVRRKGRGNTLTDPADQPVPEDTLRRFLGGVGRDLFEQSFGLNGARLRKGGDALLQSGGEAGESLLAGAGHLNLRAALTALDEEAKTLVGDGRGKRRLSEATELYKQALRATDDRAVAPKAWQEAETAHIAAIAALAEVQAESRTLAAANNRLQRVRRVAQMLAALDAGRSVLETLKDVPHLPAGAAARLEAAETARREAARDATREADSAERLTAERAALPRDPVALGVRDAIDALAERRAVAVQATADLPKVRAAAASHRAKVVDALLDLGMDRQAEAARDAVPTAGARRTVQRLIAQHAELAAKAAAAGENLATAQRRRDRAAAAVEASPAPPSPALARRTIEAVRAEGPLDTQHDQATRGAEAAERAVAAALAALPLWTGDAAALEACPVPLPAAANAAAASLDQTAKTLTDARATVARLVAAHAAIEADIARLSEGGVVPTPEAVATARAQRDRAWLVLRSALAGGAVPEGELPVGTFETLRDDADRLADQRADDAQRVADYLSATGNRDQLRRRRAETETAVAEAEAAAAGAEAAWRALWEPAAVPPDSPSAMADWRRQRTDVLQRAERSAEARRHRDDIAARRDRARQALAGHSEPLATLLLRAETACAAAEAEAAAHQHRAETLAREEAQLPDLRAAAEVAAAALTDWAGKWSNAATALGLPADASTDVAEGALGAWARIAEAAPAWRSDEDRVDAMSKTLAGFIQAAEAVRAQLGEPDRGDPAPAIAARAARRLADALAAEQTADDLSVRIALNAAAAEAATRRHDEAEADLAALRTAAGAEDDAALARIIEQARQRDATVQDIAAHGRNLAAAGDGLPETDLRAEAAGTDPDSAAARLAEIGDRLAVLGDRRESLSAERTRAEATLAEMRTGHDAAAKAQEAEDALSDARTAAERYARLHVAREMLRAGIDRYRREQQDPLLRAASAHFAMLTGDRYRRLGVDQDAAGKSVLLATDAAGGECPVDGLSEGARDQLYLALRVAAIESHVARAEPLPFVADDLLVNFDDTRAAAALRLLAELGRKTQVILFTHHDHVAEMAAMQPGTAVLRLPGPSI